MPGVMIDIVTADGLADCYLVGPAGRGRHRGVLLMMDAIGLRTRIKEMADRISEHGYVVLAPNLFYRAGRAPLWDTPVLNDPGSREQFFELLRPLRDALVPAAVSADGSAYLDRLTQLTRRPIAITGYCFGGRLGWTIAATSPDRVVAFAGFHTGGMVTDLPDSPHLLAPSIRAEVYWGHADEDPNMTTEQIAVLNKAMEDSGVRYTTELYKRAPHGYTMADQHAYNEAAAERHFGALFALLARTFR